MPAELREALRRAADAPSRPLDIEHVWGAARSLRRSAMGSRRAPGVRPRLVLWRSSPVIGKKPWLGETTAQRVHHCVDGTGKNEMRASHKHEALAFGRLRTCIETLRQSGCRVVMDDADGERKPR